MSSLFSRASAYYDKHGFKRSTRLIFRKAMGKVPWNLVGPGTGASYLKGHRKAVVNNSHNQPSYGRVVNDETELGLARAFVNQPLPAREVFGSGNIAIIGDLNLPQCKKYRVIQKIEALRKMGLAADLSHWLDVPRCVNLLQTATCVLLYRVQSNALIEQYCMEAQRLGIPVGYDIDDPIFDKPTYSANKNLDTLDKSEKVQLLSACGAYSKAFRLADFVTVSTPGMAEVARRHFAGPIHLWRNAVDLETRHAAQNYSLFGRKPESKTVRIGYASGSRAHDLDFTVAEASLIKVLDEHPEAELCIIGYHEPSEALNKHEDRITSVPFQDYPSYIECVSQFDISLVPLLSDAFNDCKSAIRYLESSVVGVPAVVTNIGDFSNIVKDGVTGFIVSNEQDWYEKLSLLVSNAELRQKIGMAAHDYVTREMFSESIVSSLDPSLLRILRNE